MSGEPESTPIPVRAICLNCNYPLRELTELRCPECGRAFDPTDPATMNLGLPMGWLARRALGPLGRSTVGAAAGLCVALLALATRPSFYYMEIFALLPLFWIVLAALLFARAFARELVRRLCEQPPGALVSDRLRYAAVWAMGLLVTLLVLVHVPVRLTFLLARPELERSLAEVRSQAIPKLSSDRRAGMYRLRASGVRRRGDVLLFFFVEDSESAFVYSPDGPPDGQYNAGTHGHLSGDWYWVAED